jgi:sensor histidine kinase YesM
LLDEDFFPKISGLYIDDMADDVGANANLNANANANLNANTNPPVAPYAICSYLFQFLLQFLILAFGIDVIYSSVLLVCMIGLISVIIIMLYYWLFQIKSYGKMLIFSTIKKPDYRQLNPSSLAAATRLPPLKVSIVRDGT